MPVQPQNLACGLYLHCRTSQEASSRNVLDFNRMHSREVLLSFAEEHFYRQNPTQPSRQRDRDDSEQTNKLET